MIQEVTLGALVLAIIAQIFILYVIYQVFFRAGPRERMSILAQRAADIDRDSRGNTKMDYALTALNRAYNNTPIL